MIQNIYMYMDSIICGLLVLISQDPSKVFTAQVREWQGSNLHPFVTKNSVIRDLMTKFLTSVCTYNPPTTPPNPNPKTPNPKHTKIFYSLNSL